MKTYLAILALLLSPFYALAQTKDDNIIITHREEKYNFVREKGEVFIKEKTVTNYECTRMKGSITVSEFYDDQSVIDKVSSNRRIKPQYNVYESESLFYSDARICHFPIYFEKVGDKAQVKFEKTYTDPRYFSRVYLTEPLYTRNKTVEIIVPEWMNVEIQERNFTGDIKKEMRVDTKNKSRVYTYTIENQKPMKRESRMPGSSHVFPHLLIMAHSATVGGTKVTYFEKLDDLYAWYHNLVKDLEVNNPVISATAQEITAGCTTDEQKIKAIFAWVQSHIRYIAFEDGIAGFKPDEAHEVLHKKYGDCKGMSNLLKALLVAAGYDARLSWVGTNHLAYDYSTPCLAADNHMICTLFWQGRMYFLDPTVKYMPLGEYPQTIQGRQTLIEDKNPGKYLLETIPSFSPALNTDSLYGEFTIDGDLMKVDARQYYMGESKQSLLGMMDSTPKDRVDAALKRFLETHKSQDKANNIRLNGVESQARAVELLYDLDYKSGVQTVGNEYYIDLDTEKEFINNDIDIEKREYSYQFRYKHRVVKHLILNIPAGYEVTHLPEDFAIERDGYRFAINYHREDGRIVYRKELVFNDILLPKDRFEQWNSDITALRKAYMEQITLTSK